MSTFRSSHQAVSRKFIGHMLFGVVLAGVACGPKATPTMTPMMPTDPAVAAADPVAAVPPAAASVAMPTQTATPQALVFPDEDFRKNQPGAGPARAFALPAVKSFALKNGIKVYLVQKNELPIVSMDLAFEGGSVTDPANKPGLASSCMSLIGEGTARLDKVAFSEALGDIASEVSAYGGFDSVGLSMSSLTKNVDASFALLSEMLLTPGMRPADFERLVKRRIESIKQSKGSPDSLLGRVSSPILYGTEHSYGKVVTEASLATITLDDCKAFASKALKPGGAKLFVVGDMDEARVRALFEGPTLAAWTGKGLPRFKPTAPQKPAARLYFVNVPGAAQSQVGMLAMGPQRKDKAFFANNIMANVYGGGFTSRINMNLREDKGYSYGARGNFNYTRDFGSFAASSSVRTDASYQSLLELVKEFAALSKGTSPVTGEELQREKSGLTLALPARFATGASALGQYRGLLYFDLPLDYYNKYVAEVEKVSAAQVNAAAKKQLRASDTVYLVIGDGNAAMIVRDPATKKDVPLLKDGKPVTLRQSLEDLLATGTLGTGGLQVLDTDGNPVK
jgi:zinc protease